MTSLDDLRLYNNALTGAIPSEIAQMRKLIFLRLDENELTGTIPTEIDALLTDLEDLYLNDNKLMGKIPTEIGLMTRLYWLSLYDNAFTGDLTCPDFINKCYISCCDWQTHDLNSTCRSHSGSQAPNVPTTPRPTKAPVMTPTLTQSQVEQKNFPNLGQTLVGVTTLSTVSWEIYKNEYMEFYPKFYNANPQFGITSIETLIVFVSQDPPARRLGEGRALQDQLTLVFNQTITYEITPGLGLEPSDVVTQPFAAQTSRDAFAQLLRESGDAAFADIESVSRVTQSKSS